MTIVSRIDRLITQLAQDSSERITVTFSDGSKRKLSGEECINLIARDAASVGRFEGGAGCRLLPDLLNGLLEQ